MSSKIIRFLCTLFMILFGYFLQNGIFSSVLFLQTLPNVLLFMTVTYAFLRGPYVGIAVGFFCGFLCDILSGGLIGFYTLIYLYIGWFSGLFNRFFYLDELVLPLILCGICDFLYGCYVYVLQFLLRGHFNFPLYLQKIILPEMVYTLIVAIVLYRIVLFIHNKCDEVEKRSARKFV
ncbi:MAG: rod shape-determining protein MreD [Lachnospiraceae bacterium]|nr:rod shape-determining protein MreD [Lachnospiraceae bacterium]